MARGLDATIGSTRMLQAASYNGIALSINRQQVLLPLRWFSALAQTDFREMERHCCQRSNHHMLITFDGSPSGGGATLQAGIRDFSSAHEQRYIAYWGGEWTKDDLRRVQVDAGDPAGQARLEAYTLLHSVCLCRKI